MSNSIVDFSFVYEMSDNDTVYVNEVTILFLKTVSEGLEKLEELIKTEDDLEQIRRQAHFLKSSANIIKVRGMYDNFIGIETAAREGKSRESMQGMMTDLVETFKQARPELEAEIEKTKPQ